MSYQDFDGKGDSKSHEKLKALRLDDFAYFAKQPVETPFAGLSVLDIGCNEGFFCLEAVRQGAKRVVGIDANEGFVSLARMRCPDATFIHGSWWDLPDENFDVILFLSAIHYEPRQKAFLERLKETLTDQGTLILECGVAQRAGHCWYTAIRADGPKRYPTESLLTRDLLSGYTVRNVGPSVNQSGDPIPRFVYHCRKKHGMALLLAAGGGKGKSTLAASFASRQIPVYETDGLLLRLLCDPHYRQHPLSLTIRPTFKGMHPLDLGKIAVFLVENGLHEALSDLIASECASDAEIFCIEGDAIRHESVRDALISSLAKSGIRSWNVSP